MSSGQKVQFTSKRKELTLQGRGTLLLTKELQDQIAYLHRKVGGKEWCGVLFYRKVEGDISDPSALVLRADNVFLMDIGRETYTDADFDGESVVDMWESVDNDYTYKRGLIHTHHGMETFFSGTDMSELHDNTHLHNYYLSLIVNFSGKYTAKVAFIADRKIIMSYKNTEDEQITNESSEEYLCMIDMDIVKEEEELAVPEVFRDRYEKIKEEASKVTYNYGNYNYGAYSGNYTGGYQPYTSNKSTIGFIKDDDGDAESELPSIRSASPGGKDRYEIDDEGNAHTGSKILRPLGKVEEEFSSKVVDWLNWGLSVYVDMKPEKKLVDISEFIDFYDDYFLSDSEENLNYFLDQMQRGMDTIFEGFSPRLVQRVGGNIMWTHHQSELGMTLYSLFDAFPTYKGLEEDQQQELFKPVGAKKSRRRNKKN